MYVCLECGKKFKSEKAAERATDDGCPKCGGTDIDLDVDLSSGFQDDPLPKYDRIGRPIITEDLDSNEL